MQLRKASTYITRFVKIRAMRYLEGALLQIERIRIALILKRSSELILIFTVGKVGSSTVYESFKRSANINGPVFHIHSLNPERIEARRNYYLSSKRRSVPFHLVQGRALSELLTSYRGRLVVVTLIRDPIQRELSGVFQDSFNFSDSINLDSAEFQHALQSEMRKIVKELPELEWFDRELKEVFDVDFLRNEFDVEKGFKVLQGPNARVGLARVEGLGKSFPEFCTELFQRPISVDLFKANLGEEKFYDEAYKQAKSSVRFSPEELDEVLNSHFINKFYSDMVGTIRKKWGNQELDSKRI